MNDIRLGKERLKPRRKKRFDTDSLQLYSLCLIPVLLVFVFNYIPMGGIIIAFKNYKYDLGIFGSDWVGLANFKYFISSSDFARVSFNTIYINFLNIIFGTTASLFLAILLYDIKSRKTVKVYQTILITPNFISWVVAGFMLYGFLNPAYGIMNGVLTKLGLEPIDWYTRPEYWRKILVGSGIWKSIGMSSILYYAALMGIDETLFEAAEIDGAKKWQRNFYIILPSLKKMIVILTLMSIGKIFRADFGMFYQLTRNVGSLYKTTDVMDTYIYRQLRDVGNMGMSSAAGLMQSVVGFVLVVISNKLSKKIDPDGGLF